LKLKKRNANNFNQELMRKHIKKKQGAKQEKNVSPQRRKGDSAA
jgi:hypothetical protein